MLTASSTETFLTAKQAWLGTVLAHPLLTPASKVVGAVLYRKFNSEHYRKTRKLKAWPEWDTITAKSALTEPTINTGIRALEHFQLLEVNRGRYDRAAQKREGNEYFARFPSPQPVNCAPYQGANSASNPTLKILREPTLKNLSVKGDSPLLIGDRFNTIVSSGTVKTGDKFRVPWNGSEEVRSTEASPPEAARSGLPSGPSARSEVQPIKLTPELEASLNRLAARNGGGR
jgi:hypothetical protein